MKETLERITQGYILTEEEARKTLVEISTNKYSDIEVTAFLFGYVMRQITAQELSGFRKALLELCIKIDFSDFNTIDLCGTGGDGKNTFGISTTSSFVVAGAGEKVVKYGNYGVSSSCGSSNIIESSGIKLTNDKNILKKSLEKTNMCYLHAPLFHPAMKRVAPIRKSLRIKTFFNMLGPLTNPSFNKNQFTGVYSKPLLNLYKDILKKTMNNYIIVHSKDGYDEVSLTDDYYINSNIPDTELTHRFFKENRYEQEELKGGNNISSSLKILANILSGNGTKAQNNVIIANASLALKCISPSSNIGRCIEKAERSLYDKKALSVLKNMKKHQN